jgi:hypothetical protein
MIPPCCLEACHLALLVYTVVNMNHTHEAQEARHMATIRKVWSPVNQAWFLMFGDSVLRVVNTREEADSLLAEWGAK